MERLYKILCEYRFYNNIKKEDAIIEVNAESDYEALTKVMNTDSDILSCTVLGESI